MDATTAAVADDRLELARRAQACEAAGQYREAHLLLATALERTGANAVYAGLNESLRLALWRTNPLWWASIRHRGTVLRRCTAADDVFFRRCFADATFRHQFNRQSGWSGNLAQALDRSGRLAPLATRLLMWVVESAGRGPVGLASLSSIDANNLRAELSVGFPGEVPPTLAVKTTLMMLHFALVMMPFNKVYTYTYADNERARHNTLRLGFVHEGRLHEHFRLPRYGFVSVDQFGMTRADLHGNERLKVLARRRIGQEW